MNNKTIASYINTQLDTDLEWRIGRIPAGASNLTYRLESDHLCLILRTSPPGTKARGAHDMKREHDWLKALHTQYKLCPQVVLYCDDESIFERPFYVMRPIDGDIIRQQLPQNFNSSDAPDLCKELIQNHHQLHQIPVEPLAQFNKGHGYIERQITGWIHRYERVKPDHALSLRISGWLTQNTPQEQPHCAIHNDFKFDNVVFRDKKITGVLDWELATIGDPLMDLGCSLAYWIEDQDSDALKQVAMMPTHLPTMWTRDQLVHAYSQLSGIQLDRYDFYYVYGLYRLAVITQQIFFRYEQGQNTNPQFAHFGHVRDLMLKQALEQIS